MQRYIGTKIINAKPMTRGEYSALRGWVVPADENPTDAGMLVEYIDGGQANVDGFASYVSWSPQAVFDGAYVARPAVVGLQPHAQRVVDEAADLFDDLTKLTSFIDGSAVFARLDDAERLRLMRQQSAQRLLLGILEERISAFTAQ